MPALHPLETRLAEAWPPEDWQDVTVLVAVSGGADSVALLRALAALKTAGEGRLVAAHLNHQLRPAEAEADQALVVELCRRLGVACEVGRVRLDLARPEGRDGLEAAARRARYQFLEATAAGLGHASSSPRIRPTTKPKRSCTASCAARASAAWPAWPGPAAGPRHADPPPAGVSPPGIAGVFLGDLGNPIAKTPATRTRPSRGIASATSCCHGWPRSSTPAWLMPSCGWGSLAGEVQAVIDSRSDELADRCVCQERPHAIRIDAAALAAEPPYLVREVLMLVWRRQGGRCRRWVLPNGNFGADAGRLRAIRVRIAREAGLSRRRAGRGH